MYSIYKISLENKRTFYAVEKGLEKALEIIREEVLKEIEKVEIFPRCIHLLPESLICAKDKDITGPCVIKESESGRAVGQCFHECPLFLLDGRKLETEYPFEVIDYRGGATYA